MPEEQFSVRMSPQFFKAVVINLSQMMGAWESQFGEIKMSTKNAEDVLAGIRAAAEAQTKQKPNS
jgi:hypothetical protein